MSTTLHALVLAGSDPSQPGDVATGEGLTNKALIEVGGVPMVRRVVDALRSSPRVGTIAVAGLETAAAAAAGIPHEVTLLPNHTALVDNLLSALEFYRARLGPDARILLLDADTPLLTGEMITWFVDACQPLDRDVYYAVVARSTVEEHFPGSKRTYLRTREGHFCSADLFVLHLDAVFRNEERLRSLIANRKSVISQVRLLGWGWVLRLLLGQIHLNELRDAGQRLLRVRGQVIELPFAEAAMDVDKPFQLAMVRNFDAHRQGRVRG